VARSLASDSQNLGFQDLISAILNDSRLQSKFRQNYFYRQVLEHVDFNLGLKYLDRIQQLKVLEQSEIESWAKSDNFGKPRKYFFKNIGWASPTLLRYASVYSELANKFPMHELGTVAEIGIGYGGQARLITAKHPKVNYHFYDLPQVQILAHIFLDKTSARAEVHDLDITSVVEQEFDLVVSNYAFSELPRAVQLEYMEKVLVRAKHVYMIMNSGGSNLTGRGEGKLSCAELMSAIPGLQIQDEIPNSGVDNYVLFK
jgi:putative sugar O-methyltransferase